MFTKKIAIVGCGNLGIAIAKGLLQSPDFKAANIIASRRNTSALTDLANAGVLVFNQNSEAVMQAEIIILAVKPYNVVPILEEIKASVNAEKHTIISVATGISIATIQDTIGKNVAVLRAMPNTAADVGESLTCICGQNAAALTEAKTIFNALGQSIVIDESLMEAATVLGACGIAYVMRFMRAMVQGGIQIGFDANTATAIVNQTVLGAAALLITRKNHPEFEIDKVTTPKGCTIIGLNEMEHNGFSSSLIKGITASYAKIEK